MHRPTLESMTLFAIVQTTSSRIPAIQPKASGDAAALDDAKVGILSRAFSHGGHRRRRSGNAAAGRECLQPSRHRKLDPIPSMLPATHPLDDHLSRVPPAENGGDERAVPITVCIPRQAGEELVVITGRFRLRRDLPEAVDLAMIEHHTCRTDHIPSRSGAIFQRPEDVAQHRLIGKHLIQRIAVKVLMLNGTDRVHHGDELIAVVDIVLRHHRLTRHRQRLVDAITGIVIRVPLMCFMPTNASKLNPDYADFSVKVHGTVDSHFDL
jgi:hypothetical protein